MDWLHVERSDSPLILTFPHGGTQMPGADPHRPGVARTDTDWHIRDLYEGIVDATLISTDISRSIVDCNRDPSGASLYPGQATTGLCPTTTFDGEPIWRHGREPDAAEQAFALETFFHPYHAAIRAEITRLKALHPRVVVYDCHSIRSRVPRLFAGDLPELNVGTDGGVTCDPALEQAVVLDAAASGRSLALNGRFRGGWTTRHYGRPGAGIHAIQMELAMRTYLREPDGLAASPDWPPPYDPDYAAPLRIDLARVLSSALAFAKE